MKVANLPAFDETIGPESARYFRAVALSKKLMAQRDRLSAEAHGIIGSHPRGFSQFEVQYNSSKPKQVTAAQAAVDDVLGDHAESASQGPTEEMRAALARFRETSSTVQELNDAIHTLGTKQLDFHVRACREYNLRVRNDYAPVGARIAAALCELAAAVDEHDQFIDALRKREVHHVSWLPLVERPSWTNIRRMLQSAFESGHISKEEVSKWADKQ